MRVGEDHTHTRARARTHARTHACTHVRTHARTHTQTNTHSYLLKPKGNPNELESAVLVEDMTVAQQVQLRKDKAE